MSDPRDADWQWKEYNVGYTVTETEAPRVYPLWRWQVRDKGNIVDQSGLWRWLRPMVRMPTLHELIVAHASSPEMMARIMEGNALFSSLTTDKH